MDYSNADLINSKVHQSVAVTYIFCLAEALESPKQLNRCI